MIFVTSVLVFVPSVFVVSEFVVLFVSEFVFVFVKSVELFDPSVLVFELLSTNISWGVGVGETVAGVGVGSVSVVVEPPPYKYQ